MKENVSKLTHPTLHCYLTMIHPMNGNTQNNSIKGITRYNLPADMHIHSFCFKLKILNNKKLKWPKFADQIKEMEFPSNMHIYTLVFRCLQSFTKFLAVV